MNAPETVNASGIGAAVRRKEDQRFLTGAGQYTDDVQLPNQTYAYFVRSPHAHAKIVSADLSAAREAPGVLAAWTMQDLRADGVGHMPFPPLFKQADGSPMEAPPRVPLAENRVFYVGEPVAAIVAATRDQAEDAAELVMIEYDELPCVVDARRALEPDAPQLWPGGQPYRQ